MQLYGKARQTAYKVLEAFEQPNNLPAALAPVFIHRKDDVPCRAWSWNNQIITALCGTSDARGYRQWQAVGRQVKRGKKAFHILIPCTKKVGEDQETGDPLYVCYGFKGAPVFRFEDTEGEPLPVDEHYENWIQSLPLREVAEHWGLSVQGYNGQNGKHLGRFTYNALTGEGLAIALGVENVGTWFHELLHAADHRLGHLVEKGQHWRSETVAEFGSAVLAECLGFERESDLGGAYEYVKRYAETAAKRPENAALECMDRICKAVALILETAESLQGELVEC